MTSMTHTHSHGRVLDRLAGVEARYSKGEEHPLGGYAILMSTYSTLVTSAVLIGRKRGVTLPERLGWKDLALASVAVHKAARRVTKDSVTSVVRAPFTEFGEAQGEGEIGEEVIGTGLRHAIGELVTCPFCLGQWIATAFVGGLFVAPRQTRALMSVFAVSAASDALQFGYAKLESTAG